MLNSEIDDYISEMNILHRKSHTSGISSSKPKFPTLGFSTVDSSRLYKMDIDILVEGIRDPKHGIKRRTKKRHGGGTFACTNNDWGPPRAVSATKPTSEGNHERLFIGVFRWDRGA